MTKRWACKDYTIFMATTGDQLNNTGRALTPQSSRFAYRCHRRLCAKAVPKVQVNPELDPYETGHSTGRPCVLSSTKRIPSAGKDVAIESSSFTIWC
ncbi:hypothetical protein PC120_g7788 [Phytophthora cactorum]|nr:hypothetical protein PC120_g7788 [Phytophthora cactorum]